MSTLYNHSPRQQRSRRLRAESLESRHMLAGVPAGAVDLGVFDFLKLSDQQPTATELWYRLEPVGDGILTADLPDETAGSGLALTLYTEQPGGNLQEEASGGLRLDLESATGGQQYVLKVSGVGSAIDVRLTNLVSMTEDGAVVYGTDGNDKFEYEAGTPTKVVIKGVDYSFDFSSIESSVVAFFGYEGYDEAWLTGSAADEVGTFEPLIGDVVGPEYKVGVNYTEGIAFVGGGGTDSIAVYGSDGQDTLEIDVWADSIEMQGTDYGVLAIGMASAELDAGQGEDTLLFTMSGGAETVEWSPDEVVIQRAGYQVHALNFETAQLQAEPANYQLTVYDSAGDDALTVAPNKLTFTGAGYSLTAQDFGPVEVDATASDEDNDTAIFNGTAGAETIELWPDYVKFDGGSASVQAWGFNSVTAESGGGNDLAAFYDSAGDDHFEGAPDAATLSGPGFELAANHFGAVEVRATEGGEDVVELFDSDGDDLFVGAPDYAAMEGDAFSIKTWGFGDKFGYATGGTDVAKLYDSPGNDSYVGAPTYNAVTGEGFKNEVRDFEAVHVFATAGGVDVAKLYDSSGNDQYVASPTYAAMFGVLPGGGGFYNRAKYFEGVHAYATAGGIDEARFYDSTLDDDFVATPTYAALFNSTYKSEYTNGFYNRAKYFEGAHAFATAGGDDLARLYDSPEDDRFVAHPTYGALFNNTYQDPDGFTHGFYNRAKFFEGVHAYATDDGRDTADLWDSAADDKFVATPSDGALFRPGAYYNRAKFFEVIHAHANQGGNDEAELSDSALVDLLEAGPDWARLSNATLDFLREASGFDYVKAIATAKGNLKVVPSASELLFALDLEGPW